jgi:hypothetical protein
MKKNCKKFDLNRMLAIFTFMFGSLVANAQSWNWSDCVDWLRYEGFETLATLAHPTNDMKSYSIDQTSPDVIVKINFEGTFVDFSVTYKIVRGDVNGKPYFKDVKVLSERTLIKSFIAWNEAPKFHPQIYRDNQFWYFYDGVRNFEDLPLGKKAAAALTMEFVAKQ